MASLENALRRPRTWLVLGIVYTALFGYLLRDFRHDDAYITFRYGQNVVLGRGLVFNPGERVLGATSVLEMLLSIPMYAIAGQAMPILANVLGVVAIAATSWMLYWLTATFVSRRWAIWVAVLTALGAAGQFACVALETNLVLALVLGSMCLAVRDRFSWAASTAGLAYLARPDAVLALPSLVAIYWIRRRAVPWREAIIFAAICVVWHAFARIYYGTWLPNTLAAKLGNKPFVQYLWNVMSAYRDQAVWPSTAPLDPRSTVRFFGNAVVVPLLVGAWTWLRAGWTPAALLLYPALLMLGYAIVGPPTDQLWHTVPAAAFGIACVVIGLGRIGEFVGQQLFDVHPRGPQPAWTAALVVAFAGVHFVGAVHFINGYRDMFWYGQRDRKYTEIAEALKGIVRPGEKVLTWEVGTLAFKSDLHYIDGLGLISPGIRGIQSADGKVPRTPLSEIVRRYDPQWVLIASRMIGDRPHPEWPPVRHLFAPHTRFDSPVFMQFTLLRRLPGA